MSAGLNPYADWRIIEVEFLPVNEVAKRLNLTDRHIRRLCQAGTLYAVEGQYRGRKQTLVEWFDGIEEKLAERKTKRSSSFSLMQKDHKSLFEEWKLWAKQGFISRKPLSEETIDDYSRTLERYFEDFTEVSAMNLRQALLKFNIEQYSRRYMLYSSLMCYAKFLIKKGIEEPSLREEMKEFRPVRFSKPRRTVLTSTQLEAFFNFIDTTKYYTEEQRALNRAIMATFVYAGLRNSELCNLLMKDVDLEGSDDGKKSLYFLGKGNKWRRVGINCELEKVLREYLKFRPKTDSPYFFVNHLGNGFVRTVIASKVRDIRKHLNIDITPHGLRRTFATENARKGRPITNISYALGHNDLKTTQLYLMTTEEQVVADMQNW
jgi:site-specific recombinase XerD